MNTYFPTPEQTMHIVEIFENGHSTLMNTLARLDVDDTTVTNVCGEWSVKDILIHLTSFEQILGDLLLSLQGTAKDTERLRAFIYDADFNDAVVCDNRYKSYNTILAEYIQAHQRASDILIEFPEELRRMQGILAWYGEEYDLDDFIAYTFYGHKVEHSAQIATYRDSISHTRVLRKQGA